MREGLEWLDFVSQYNNCIVTGGPGWLGLKIVLQYNYCIVGKRRLGWKFCFAMQKLYCDKGCRRAGKISYCNTLVVLQAGRSCIAEKRVVCIAIQTDCIVAGRLAGGKIVSQ